MVRLECDLVSQNCASLFHRNTKIIKGQYQAGSCVRDARLDPSIGRCGFPGAPCTIDSAGNDNCAYGGDNTIPHYKSICINGKCGGGLGATCRNGDYDCNWGYYCNSSWPAVGVCGGQGSFVSSQGDSGDFALDYCLSGKATFAPNGFWYCLGGVFNGTLPWSSATPSSSTTAGLPSSSIDTTRTSLPVSSSSGASAIDSHMTTSTPASSSPDDLSPASESNLKRNIPIIAGVCTAIGVVIVVVLLYMAWRVYNKRQRQTTDSVNPTSAQTPTAFHSTGVSDKALSMFVPSIQSGPQTGQGYSYSPEIQPTEMYTPPVYHSSISGQNTDVSYSSFTNDQFLTPVRRTME